MERSLRARLTRTFNVSFVICLAMKCVGGRMHLITFIFAFASSSSLAEMAILLKSGRDLLCTVDNIKAQSCGKCNGKKRDGRKEFR